MSTISNFHKEEVSLNKSGMKDCEDNSPKMENLSTWQNEKIIMNDFENIQKGNPGGKISKILIIKQYWTKEEVITYLG